MCDVFDEEVGSQENVLAQYLLKQGHQVTILTSTFDNVFDYIADRYDASRPGRSYNLGSLKVIRAPYRLNILHKLRSFRGAGQIIREERPDMIFMFDIMPDMIEAVRYKQANPQCRFVMDYHADYSNSAKNWLSLKVLHGVIRKAILNLGLPYLDAVYPITPASADFLHEVYGLPRERLELLPLGSDMDLGIKIAERREGRELRREMGISETSTVIVTGGKFARPKRTELLIEAVQRLKHRSIDLVVVGAPNVGEEGYAAELQAAAIDNPHIHFVGWLDSAALFRHMDMADLAVFPASQSILWVQAVSMGLPLIVGNTGSQDTYYMNAHGNIIELSRDEICVEKLAETIDHLMSDPDRLASMSDGARRTYTEVLDWNMLVHKVVGQPLPPPSEAGALIA